MRKKVIGVFGAGRLREDDPLWRQAEEVGQRLALAGCIVLTGGLGGVMAAASRGARAAGGLTIGILPGDRRRPGPHPNPDVDIAIFTGMDEARNVINVKTCDAAIAIGGEYGTLSEIALALKVGCPLVLLASWSLCRPDGGAAAGFFPAVTPEEAVRLAIGACGP
ncbi:MAG: TIGR00725 family protein [Desulfobacteraceae bacterium]|nr:TIGR00725 family protein [Desulfobacteraceae bacterium]